MGEPLYIREVREILGASGFGEDDTGEAVLEQLFDASVFSNALAFGSRINRIYQVLRASYPDPEMVTDEVENLNEVAPTLGVVGGIVARRAIHTPHQSLDEEALVQRFPDGRSLEQRVGTLADGQGAELRYGIALWSRNVPDAEPSRVDITLDLPDEYAVELSYVCDESGEPIEEQPDDEGIVYWRQGEPCEPDEVLIARTKQLLQSWDLLRADI